MRKRILSDDKQLQFGHASKKETACKEDQGS
jgi:hypothetical protein